MVRPRRGDCYLPFKFVREKTPEASVRENTAGVKYTDTHMFALAFDVDLNVPTNNTAWSRGIRDIDGN